MFTCTRNVAFSWQRENLMTGDVDEYRACSMIKLHAQPFLPELERLDLGGTMESVQPWKMMKIGRW